MSVINWKMDESIVLMPIENNTIKEKRNELIHAMTARIS